ncbi:MAG: calycin-like domain-containing protein [Muribaculaceae bacterium]|nr:calycin-like domain-containing protein [Muribaculaceae bacterium]
MKNFYKSLLFGLAAVGLAFPAAAQQLPNPGFEDEWVDCVPFTTDSRTKATGKMPPSWTISHVSGIASMGFLGATEVGAEAVGYNSTDENPTKAAKLINSPNSMSSSQTVPGYMTLGTTWSTSTVRGTTPSNKDGGSFGGIDFSYRPDAIGFRYLRERAEGSTEQSTIVLYSWKGEWSQADVPANLAYSLISTPKATPMEKMVNRERNILEMETAQGGAVTSSDDAELISKLVYNMTDEANPTEWKEFYQEIPYLTNSTPTKFNIIFAAGDYFSDTNITKDNSLTVDDVKLYYFSRMESMTYGDKTITADETKPVEVDALYDASVEPTFKLIGQTAKATYAYDEEACVLTVTVTNVDADRDGKKEHVYRFQFNSPVYEITGEPYSGYLNVSMEGQPIIVNQNSTVYINNVDDTNCIFGLPDFKLGELELDIVVPSTYSKAADGTVTYTGEVKGMTLVEDLVADVKLNGTIKDNVVDMKIDVMWGEVEIPVTFTTAPVGTVEYPGFLNVEFMDDMIVLNETRKVEITPSTDEEGNTTCIFTLPNFELSMGGEVAPLGDIVVPGVVVTSDGTSTKYEGKVEGMELLGGEITADVTLTGTIKGDVVDMKIDVVWQELAIPVTFTTEPQFAENYDGYLNVEFVGEMIAENEGKQIVIYPTLTASGENSCTFMLPDFTLADLGSLGDIIVPGVLTTTEGTVTKYEGNVPELSLADGEITAKVDLEGTIDNDDAIMFIDVDWQGIKIPVTFTTRKVKYHEVDFESITETNRTDETFKVALDLDCLNILKSSDEITYEVESAEVLTIDAKRNYITPLAKEGMSWVKATSNGTTREFPVYITESGESGIEAIDADNDGAVEYYDLRGVKVNIDNAAKGVYISRQGDKVVKVVK